MKNIFKDLVDVAKYKKERNTAVNNYETLENKYTELLETHIDQQDVIKKNMFDLNNKVKELTERVSNLETKRKK